MPDLFGQRLGEGAVAVIDVQIVVALKIVGDVDVRATVHVEIADDDAEAIPIDSVVQSRPIRDIGEMTAVVSEQPVARARAARARLSLCLDRPLAMRRVIQQVHVQIAITVVVEEDCLGRISDVLESILLRSVGESAVAVVDVEHVVAVHGEVVDGGNVDVDLPVSVDVGHGDAGFPPVGISDARLPGDVLELIIPFIPIKPVRTDVRREIQIREPITVDIADCDATAIVVVEVVDDVEARLRQGVGEGHSG